MTFQLWVISILLQLPFWLKIQAADRRLDRLISDFDVICNKFLFTLVKQFQCLDRNARCVLSRTVRLIELEADFSEEDTRMSDRLVYSYRHELCASQCFSWPCGMPTSVPRILQSYTSNQTIPRYQKTPSRSNKEQVTIKKESKGQLQLYCSTLFTLTTATNSLLLKALLRLSLCGHLLHCEMHVWFHSGWGGISAW